MIDKHIINIEELKPFGSVETISGQAKTLVLQQQSAWPLAKTNYHALNKTETRVFNFGSFNVMAQYNPERIRSSAAKTDAKSITQRPCFLCSKNLPEEQKGFLLFGKYLVLANPYPIFNYHLTISNLCHTPQLIQGRIDELLKLSRELNDFTLFYNGPDCGASAPDHFHFQAGISGNIPVEAEAKANSEIIYSGTEIIIYISRNYLRHFILLESGDPITLSNYFNTIYNKMSKSAQEPEPMMNILCRFKNGTWNLVLFPRKKQRPIHFFRKGDSQIVIGPASVEMGGLLILPRKEDFDKITKKEIKEIFKDITFNEVDFMNLTGIF